MEIKEIGEFAFVDRLTKPFTSSIAQGIGDDAAVIEIGGKSVVLSKDLLLEGIDFDLTYTPLRHLGYRSVVKGISDIAAMNVLPKYIMIAIGISARFKVEDIEELYDGVKIACDEYELELIGGDTSASLTGLTISVTAVGEGEKEDICTRKGAKVTDIVCVTGDLGAAYLGTKLLEREKHVLRGDSDLKPKFDGFEYQLERALKPRCRTDLIRHMKSISLHPTSMIDLSDGLASDLKQLCKASACSANIYLDKLPITETTYDLAKELGSDATIAAMNGGDDYEMLFTVSINDYDKIIGINGVSVIGHITDKQYDTVLISPDGAEIEITAPGHNVS